MATTSDTSNIFQKTYLVELYPEALRTHILRPLGPKTTFSEAFGIFWRVLDFMVDCC